MNDACGTLRENGIYQYSIKTDALTILKTDLPKAKELLNFKHERGAWRTQKDFASPTIQIEMIDNFRFCFMNHIFKNAKQTRIDTPDEWNSQIIAEEIVKHKKVLIRARYPGSGKTYTCKYLYDLGYTVLSVYFTNVGAQNNTDDSDKDNPKYKGITINNFLVLV